MSLSDEELREVARSFTEQSIEAAAVNDNSFIALRARVARLEAALISMTKGANWKSGDKDNMEFEGRVTCYQLDQARAALEEFTPVKADAPQ